MAYETISVFLTAAGKVLDESLVSCTESIGTAIVSNSKVPE